MTATIISSIVTAGTNNHTTVSEEANAVATDFVTAGVVGTLTNTGGVAPATGGFSVNQDSTPDMGVLVGLGVAYVTGTPSGQSSQALRARMSSNYAAYTIAANTSGSTKYDWIYLKLDATAAATPSAAADDVITLYTSRSTSNVTDNGTPPTYGIPLAVVTVSNGASSIVNANITDKRTRANIDIGGAIDDGSITGVKLAADTVTPDKMLGVDIYGRTTAFSGSAPTAGSGQFYMQAGTSVVTLVSGVATATLPTPFPNGLLTAVICQGDNTQTVQYAFAVDTPASASSFTVKTISTASGSTRINWIAIGF